MRALLLALLVAAGPAYAGLPQGDLLPDDAGQIIAANSGVVCNGTSAASAAIQAVITAQEPFNQKPIIQLPQGVCRVTGDIGTHGMIIMRSDDPDPFDPDPSDGDTRWMAHIRLRGAGMDKTILRLDDNHPDFQDANNPRPILFFASKHELEDNGLPERHANGGGNKAFRNGLLDLTVDCGTGNPGCIAVDYLGNNVAEIRNVRITNAARDAHTGLKMTRYGQGPQLLKNVIISGFGVCIETFDWDFTVAAEYVRCESPRDTCWKNGDTSIALRRFTCFISGAVPITSSRGFVFVTDSSFIGDASALFTLTNSGQITTHKLRASPGFTDIVSGTAITPTNLANFSTVTLASSFPGETTPGWDLVAPLETPQLYHTQDPSKWANVVTYGATSGGGDDRAAFEAAFATGRPIAYVPFGTYNFTTPATVPCSVRRIELANSTLVVDSVDGAFRTKTQCSTHLTIHRGNMSTSVASAWSMTLESNRAVVLEDIQMSTASGPRIQGGRVFIENVAMQLIIPQGRQAYARQLNIESDGSVIPSHGENTGGKLWVFSFKTERTRPLLITKAGGCTVLLGGQTYSTTASSSVTAFRVENATGRFAIAETAYNVNNAIDITLEHDRVGVVTTVPLSAQPARGSGRLFGNVAAPGAPCP